MPARWRRRIAKCVCPSFYPKAITQRQLNEFSRNFTLANFIRIWTLFYLTNVNSHFPSASVSYRTLACNKQLVDTSTSSRKILPPPSVNTANENVKQTAVHYTKLGRLRLRADWSSGKHCAACCQAKRHECRVVRVLNLNNILVFSNFSEKETKIAGTFVEELRAFLHSCRA